MTNLAIIISIVSSTLIFGIILFIRKNYLKNSVENKLELFKSKADKIKVNLLEAEIKSNKWTEKIMTDEANYSGLNQLNGEPEKNFKFEDKVITYLKIKTKYKGKIIEYGRDIKMDVDNLKIHLNLQKETYLYVDSTNHDEKYLDLEFLNL